jgi:acyl-CoA synthetase (AMP-forming)/AMP-acid ligase II/4-hydroxybenzoate polyprenyltransferase
MNCVELFLHQARDRRNQAAIWMPTQGPVTFGDLLGMAVRVQQNAWASGLKSGDTILVMVPLSPTLYAVVLGLIAAGMSVVLVEPWLKVSKIDRIIANVKPEAFVAGSVGRLWGSRVARVRAISRWLQPSDLLLGRPAPLLHLAAVSPDAPAIITFTSGTSGSPKGMVRSHGYLQNQHRILTSAVHQSSHEGPVLTIFANFVLSNLASGSSSVIIPPNWHQSHLDRLNTLPKELQPTSVTCGPAFLKRLLATEGISSLEHFCVGGALTDCSTFQQGFEKWPHAEWTHLYGSTEAEPVATADAREAVRKSIEAGFYQTLFLGNPIPEISSQFDAESVWVTGPHVCPEYLASEQENQINKRRDEAGQVWHRMGDRIHVKSDGWWFAGRSQLPEHLFVLEQRIYSAMRSSSAFVVEKGHVLEVYTENISMHRDALEDTLEKSTLPNQHFLIKETIIKRDARHRARIDRKASIQASRPLARLARKLPFVGTESTSRDWGTQVVQAAKVFLQERFSVPVHTLIAGGLTASGASLWIDHIEILPLFLSFVGVVSFFGLLRLMDEIKDHQKDLIAHPSRPLPRGAFTAKGVKQAIGFWTAGHVAFALVLSLLGFTTAGVSFALLTAYLWLMYKEFFVGRWLEERMLVYATSHQLVLILLCGFTVALGDSQAFFEGHTYSYGLTVLGAFFTYEICRKLDPTAHDVLRTYRKVYGINRTGGLVTSLTALAMLGGYLSSVAWVTWPFALAVAISYWLAVRGKYRIVEGLASASLLIHLWALAVPI